MALPDPFAALGLDRDATAADVRAARRRLAKAHHPDQGGDAEQMQVINEAADAALAATDSPTVVAPPPSTPPGSEAEPGRHITSDVPSFTVEALPVETFEALLVVTSWMGEVLDDDPPYRLDAYLSEPFDCWCRLDVVPDAGASTVSLTVAGLDDAPAPDVIAVRDAWITNLNIVDWE